MHNRAGPVSRAFSCPIVHLPTPPYAGDHSGMAETDDRVILRRDYTSWWCLPPPLPRRFPFIDLGWLIVLAGVVLASLLFAVGGD